MSKPLYCQIIVTLVGLFVYTALGTVFSTHSNYSQSCIDAINIESTENSFCFVSWISAKVYRTNHHVASDRYQVYRDALSYEEQDDFALHAVEQLTANLSMSNGCKAALTDFICLQIFPECVVVGNVQPFGPCQSECRRVASKCPSNIVTNFNCESYQSRGCMVHDTTEDSSFDGALPEDRGPYTAIPILYAVVQCLDVIVLVILIVCKKMEPFNNKLDSIWNRFLIVLVIKMGIDVLCFVFWLRTLNQGGTYDVASLRYVSYGHHVSESGAVQSMLI